MAVVQGEQDKGGAAAPRSSAASRLAARRAAKAAAKAQKRGTAPVVPTAITRKVVAAKTWFDVNQRFLLAGLVAVVLAGGAWFAIGRQSTTHGHEAADLLASGVTTANAPIIAPGEEPPGDAPDESYPSAKARAQKAQAAFANVVKRFPDSAAATWATLGEANALSDRGAYAQAQKLYASVADRSTDDGVDAFARWRALEGLGYALEGQHEYADAQKRFAQIGDLDKGAFKAVADYHQARMLIALGDKKKAADMLQSMIKAERAKPAGEGARFESVVTEAETLLNELAVELDQPELRSESASGGAPGASSGGGAGLTQDIVDALRKQLATGKGGKGLTKDIVDQLAKQVKTGGSSAKTVQIPAPKQAPAKPEQGAGPAGESR